MDENENRNEIAATLFSVLAGLAVLLLAGWIMTTKSCSGPNRESDILADAAPKILPVAANTSNPEVDQLRLQANADTDAYERKISALESDKEDLVEEIQEKEGELGKKETEILNLNNKIASLEGAGTAEVETEDNDAEWRLKVAELESSFKTKKGSMQETIDGLQIKLDELNKKHSKLKTQAAGATAGMIALGVHDKVKADLATQSSLVTKLEADLVKAREAMNKGDDEKISQLIATNNTLKNDLAKFNQESSDKIKLLTANNDSLKKQLEDLKKSSANKNELAKLKKTKGDLEAQIAKLTAGSTNSAAVQKENNSLKTELAKLKGAADREQALALKIKSLTKENSGLNDDIEELKGQIVTIKNADKLQPAVAGSGLNLPLLVNDPAKLDSRLVPLFVELKDIADYEPGSKDRVYNAIRERGKASPVNNVYFGSGSAAVGDDKKAELKTLLEANPDSRFLVVGYASIDGSAASNAQLSSKRASEVAQQIVQGSGDANNRVQAVYFGQTARFDTSKPEPNRQVEVWRVDK